jgi:tetratricopeptide (TPR) repeat protein
MKQMKRILFVVLGLCVLLLDIEPVKAQFNKQYFYYMGRRFIVNSNYGEAIEMLNTLLRYDASVHEAFFLRGVAKYNLDDLVGAEMDYTRAIKLNPVFTLAYEYRAIAYARLGNYDQALRDFREAINLRPDQPSPYYSRGVTYLLTNQLDEAIQDFNQFIRMNDRVAEAFINRGTCYLLKKDTVAAMSDFNRAIKTNHYNPDGYNRRGGLYMVMERYDSAMVDFNSAIANDKSNFIAHFNRALVYANTNRPVNAIEDLNNAIQIDSTNSLTYFNRAILRAQIGDYNRALDDYDRVARRNPGNVLVFYNRAALQTLLGNEREAIEDYSRAIDLYPDFANAYLLRSELKRNLGDMKGSKRDYDVAVKKIAEYQSKLKDSTFTSFADTSKKFNKLLAFDSEFGSNEMSGDIASSAQRVDISLMPMFKFTYYEQDSTSASEQNGYQDVGVDKFLAELNHNGICLTNKVSNIDPQKMMKINIENERNVRNTPNDWVAQLKYAASQTLVRQYTSAIATFAEAIRLNPNNPYIYLCRSTTQSEMIDFISSIDNSYQKIVIDTDPANRLRNSSSRVYNYDEAVADLNRAAELCPDFAHIYYNRGNLKCLSGDMPGAIEDYTRAIELYPYFAEAYYNRGLVQIYLKDTKKGCLDISKAGELGVEQAYEVLKKYQRAGLGTIKNENNK